jgi:hypothetical protein
MKYIAHYIYSKNNDILSLPSALTLPIKNPNHLLSSKTAKLIVNNISIKAFIRLSRNGAKLVTAYSGIHCYSYTLLELKIGGHSHKEHEFPISGDTHYFYWVPTLIYNDT